MHLLRMGHNLLLHWYSSARCIQLASYFKSRLVYLTNTDISSNDILQSFGANDNQFQAFCREQLFQIMKDSNLDRTTKTDRLFRYLDEYIDLICKIDHKVYIHNDEKVYRGVPIYIPDRLSDMGADPIINNDSRLGREKITYK